MTELKMMESSDLPAQGHLLTVLSGVPNGTVFVAWHGLPNGDEIIVCKTTK